MKRPEINKQYVTVGLYAFGVALVSFLFALAVFRAGAILAFLADALGAIRALVYGIGLALILYPFVNAAKALYSRLLERRRQRPRLVRTLSLLTVYLGMLLVIAILLLGIIPPMIGTVSELFTLITEAAVSAEAGLRSLFADTPFLSGMGDEIVDYAKNALQGLVNIDIAGQATAILTGVVGETFDILVGLVISLYLLAGRRLLGGICGKAVAALLPPGGARRTTMFIKRLYSNLTEFISSRILSALFLGVAAYLLFLAFGIPYYPLLALIIMICNLFPVFGTVLSLFFCALVILITRPVYTLPVLIILLGLEVIDNLLIEPHTMPHKVLRQNVGSTIVLMLLGYALFGILGSLVAIPVFATVQNSLRSFTVHLLNRRHLPTAIEDYRKLDAAALLGEREHKGAASTDGEEK